ncbi:Hypothetical protein PHPALM_8781 [Phytophthora palmivora]|uniref:Uncharacterized protein n=1 Tax=Phytophthora palmivora TaxID=4796 RepID=A0A2P4Y8Z6_9STRA|nr:Hypothetical protein PHPALM_8781 [Phytophthora palmivora]
MNNERLRRELFQQTSLLRSYRSVLSTAMPYCVDLNMRDFLHTATKLPKNLQARSRCLEAVCTDAKLDLATHILLNETKSTRPFTTPSFSWEALDLGSSAFGITSIAVFALDTANVCRTFEAASNAIVNCAVMWPNYSLTNSSVKRMDMLSTKLGIRYEVSNRRFQSGSSGEQVILENRDISYGRVGDESSVLIWDFVDEDEEFPLNKATTVKRSTIGALLVRPERCDDGEERVVCRYICTKLHAMNTPELPPDIQRFARSSQLGAKLADSMVYEAIKGVVTLSAM